MERRPLCRAETVASHPKSPRAKGPRHPNPLVLAASSIHPHPPVARIRTHEATAGCALLSACSTTLHDETFHSLLPTCSLRFAYPAAVPAARHAHAHFRFHPFTLPRRQHTPQQQQHGRETPKHTTRPPTPSHPHPPSTLFILTSSPSSSSHPPPSPSTPTPTHALVRLAEHPVAAQNGKRTRLRPALDLQRRSHHRRSLCTRHHLHFLCE